jgi:hydrophobe/amphiphile efflux-1 (HAE1) family protein
MHYDTTRFVSAAMHDVVVTLIEALILVVFVVYVFLQNWRATVIPTIAIPVSLVATLAVMQTLGFSLNMLSLLGMVLAIGLVVDDAIVVVENVERQLEAGLPPLAAARKAMSEVTGPIIATTAVLMAVFVPVAFIPGVAGRLYNQFALTVAISVGISAFNSLTLSPALSAALLRHGPKGTFFLFRWFNSGFEWLSRAYARAVRQFIRFGWALVGVFLIFVGAAYVLSRTLPTTFLPVEDQGYFFVIVQLPDGSSLERTDAVAKKVRDVLQATPGVDIAGFISGLNFLTNAAQSNSAVEFAVLKPWSERGPEENASNLVAQVRPKLLAIPEAFALSFDPPSVNGLGTTGGFEFEVEDLVGQGSAALNDATQALIAAARKQPELNPQSLFTSFSASTPQLYYDLDRTKAKLLGLNLPDIFNTLQIYLGSLYVNDFNLFGHTFRVTLQADKDSRASPSDLSKLYVRNATGGMTPLSALGSLTPIVGPETVPHYNNYGSALINGAAAPGFSSSQAVVAMQRAAADALPRDFGYEWTGVTFQELSAGSIATVVMALAIFFVFMILAAQYESWSMPFMVLSSAPLALVGALGALWIRQLQIDVYSQIGFVMLIGLAAKNAILIVEFAKRRRAEGLGVVEAAMEAGRLRLRPILMTAFAFIFGVLPLMFATGAGAASRQSLGTTVFGGMVAATTLTLIFVPVFYALIERAREGRRAAAPEHNAVPGFTSNPEAAE